MHAVSKNLMPTTAPVTTMNHSLIPLLSDKATAGLSGDWNGSNVYLGHFDFLYMHWNNTHNPTGAMFESKSKYYMAYCRLIFFAILLPALFSACTHDLVCDL